MGGACSAYGGRIEAFRGFWWGDLKEKGTTWETQK